MYELTYIINSNLPESEVVAQTDRVRGFINQLGGEIKNEKLTEKRKLAYLIKKQGFGFYVTVEFNLEPEKLIELEKHIKLDTDILRYLLVVKEKIKIVPRRLPSPRPKPTAFPKAFPETKAEKVKIEEIDKKLEEILEE